MWAGQTDAVDRLNALHPKPPAPDRAKLSDAQLVIARGYGFHRWADLKEKIAALTQTPLEQWIAAVKSGDVDRVKTLFDRHPELDQHVNDQVFAFDTSAVFAAAHGSTPNLELLDLLIAHGADVNLKSGWWAGGFGLAEGHKAQAARALLERGVTEDIWVAVELNHTECVMELLDADPSLITARGGDGKQPLHYAQTPEMVDLLVERGADVHARDIDHTGTAAQYLVRNEPVVRQLLHHGAAADIYLAAALGDVDLLQQCIDADSSCVAHRLGTEPWVNDAGGHIYNWSLGHQRTPLDVAMEFGHIKAHRMMLSVAPPVVQFVDAAWCGDLQRAEAIRTTHPDVTQSMTEDDHAALNRACWSHRIKAVHVMLQLGFNRHTQDDEQMVPIQRAVFHGYVDIARQLLNGDPEPELEWQNQYGGTTLQTCMHGAVHGWKTDHPQDHAACVRLLLNAGAKVEPSWLPIGHDEIDQVLRAAFNDNES